MANVIIQTVVQIGHDKIEKRMIVQYHDDVAVEDKQVIVNYDDLSAGDKVTYDAYQALCEAQMV